MPWNECKPMDERLRFVARLLEGGVDPKNITLSSDGNGSMPSFKATMSEADIAAVALYVSKASGGAK